MQSLVMARLISGQSPGQKQKILELTREPLLGGQGSGRRKYFDNDN